MTAARQRDLLQIAHESLDPHARRMAKQVLFDHHAPLVATIVGRRRRPGLTRRALMDAGEAGLRDAIDACHVSDSSGRDVSPGFAESAIASIVRHVDQAVAMEARRFAGVAVLAHRQLLRMGPKLLKDAQRDCAREGVRATDTELFGRVSRRVGLPFATVAALLRLGFSDAQPSVSMETSNVSRLDHVRARRRLIVLAETILGFRERLVYFARCLASPGAEVGTDRLSRRLGVPAARVLSIEASARRKIATAGWVEGLTGPAWADAPAGKPVLGRRGGVQIFTRD